VSSGEDETGVRGIPKYPVVCKKCGSKRGFPKLELCRLCQMNEHGILRKKRVWTDGEIALLRDAYSDHKQLRAKRKRLSELSGLTRSQIDSKARELRLCSEKHKPYTPIELKYIAENVREMTVEEIAEVLGRSPYGIKKQIYQMRLSAKLSTDGYSQKTLAEVMGVPASTVHAWITRGHIQTYAGKIPECRVKEFLESKSHLYTLSKVDEFWFKQLIFGH